MIENNTNTISEIWKAIPDFLAYQVSNYGRVMSFWRRSFDGFGRGGKIVLENEPQKILQSAPDRGGYLRVCLVRDNKRYSFRIHRLVLTVFIGPCPPGYEACHTDGKRNNNFLENLRWDMPANNDADTKRHGLLKGMNSCRAKLANSQIIQIRELATIGHSRSKIGTMFGVNQSTISRIVLRQRWGHI